MKLLTLTLVSLATISVSLPSQARDRYPWMTASQYTNTMDMLTTKCADQLLASPRTRRALEETHSTARHIYISMRITSIDGFPFHEPHHRECAAKINARLGR
jgi:hypothetical protein